MRSEHKQQPKPRTLESLDKKQLIEIINKLAAENKAYRQKLIDHKIMKIEKEINFFKKISGYFLMPEEVSEAIIETLDPTETAKGHTFVFAPLPKTHV